MRKRCSWDWMSLLQQSKVVVPQLRLKHQLGLILLQSLQLLSNQLGLTLLILTRLLKYELKDLASDNETRGCLSDGILGLADPRLELRDVLRLQVDLG